MCLACLPEHLLIHLISSVSIQVVVGYHPETHVRGYYRATNIHSFITVKCLGVDILNKVLHIFESRKKEKKSTEADNNYLS